MKVSGNLEKMHAQLGEESDKGSGQGSQQVHYQLRLSDQSYELNSVIGQQVRLEYLGQINCTHCNRKSKKSFSQGYCYPCFIKLARCDTCMIKPETCHFEQGTCREPDWAQSFCFNDHVVYLANSSGLKVGITRASQVPTRWIDQGAIQAIPLVRVGDRKLSGLIEVHLAQDLADKTNWRAMLKGQVDILDMHAEREKLAKRIENYINNDLQVTEINRYSMINTDAVHIGYPVLEYPQKVVSFNFDKTPIVEGQLRGIKGQYLILDTGVINLRKFGGYQIEFSTQT